jgi:hypothetical protein
MCNFEKRLITQHFVKNLTVILLLFLLLSCLYVIRGKCTYVTKFYLDKKFGL